MAKRKSRAKPTSFVRFAHTPKDKYAEIWVFEKQEQIGGTECSSCGFIEGGDDAVGTICSTSGAEEALGIKLAEGKTYRITVEQL